MNSNDIYKNHVCVRKYVYPCETIKAYEVIEVFVCYRIGTIYEDVTTEVAGKIGYWQWHVTLVSTTLMMLPMFNQYEDMFLLKPAEVYCVLPNEYEIINSSLCIVTVANNGTEDFKCNKWHLKLMWIVWIKKAVLMSF